MDYDRQIEAILFYKAEPVPLADLQKILHIPPDELTQAITKLESQLHGRGVQIVRTETSVELATAPECAEIIASLEDTELSRDIGKAGAETLAIILYRGPLTRSEIDHIRGVNSTFILRNLLTRGLIERIEHPTISRSYQYRSTTELLKHLGITKREELPSFATVMDALDSYEQAYAQSESES